MKTKTLDERVREAVLADRMRETQEWMESVKHEPPIHQDSKQSEDQHAPNS